MAFNKNVLFIFCFMVHFRNRAFALEWYKEIRDRSDYVTDVIYHNLWTYGCCKDKIECSENNLAGYLGMDLFTHVPHDKAILALHQLRLLWGHINDTLQVRSQLPLQLVGYRAPQHRKFYTLKEAYQRICDNTTELDDKVVWDQPKIITGFTVPGRNKVVIVCENKVFKINVTNGLEKAPNVTETLDRNKCGKDHKKELAVHIHPVYCNQSEGQLVSITEIPTKENDDNPYVLGFYSQRLRHDKSRKEQNYTVKVWRYKNPQPTETEPILKKNLVGHLSEVGLYKVDKEKYYGLYFTNEGYAYPFEKRMKDVIQTLESGQFNFDDVFPSRQPPTSFQIYIGCPQPWCFTNRIDASFTVAEDGRTVIYLITGHYHWSINYTGLPLDVPKVGKARRPFPVKKADISQTPCTRFVSEVDFPICLVAEIGAAFAHNITYVDKGEVQRDQYVYLYSTEVNRFYVSKLGHKSSATNYSAPFNIKKDIDAAWFNWHFNEAVLFFGNNYASFNPKGHSGWDHGSVAGFLSEHNAFKELDRVDAVVNIPGKGYFFRDNIYLEVDEGSLRNPRVTKPSKMLSMKSFFDVRGECYANDEEAYEKLVGTYKRHHNVSQEGVTPIVTARPEQSTGTKKAERSRILLVAIVIFGIIIAIGGCTSIYVYSRRKESHKRKPKHWSNQVKKDKPLHLMRAPSIKSEVVSKLSGGSMSGMKLKKKVNRSKQLIK